MFFRINKESIPLKLTMTSSLWLRSLSAFLFFPQLKALDTELWFKLASSISSSLSLFFPLIELLCSGKSVVCLYFIFLLAHLLSIVLFFFSFPLKIQPRKEQTRQHFFLPVTCVRSIHWSVWSRHCHWGHSFYGHSSSNSSKSVSTEAGKWGVWVWESERNSKETCFKTSGSCCKTPFYWGSNLTLFLIKVDLCDGYVMYIFLPLFSLENDCIS